MSNPNTEASESYRFEKTRIALGKAIGLAICIPKMKIGRRRHDGTCDWCDGPIEGYAGEKLDFPLDDLSPEASSSTEKLRAMLNAEYVRICLECSAEEDSESSEVDPMDDSAQSTTEIEHPTPTCPNCGGQKTRPLDDEVATCFDCDDAWKMIKEVQQEVAEWYADTGGDRNGE